MQPTWSALIWAFIIGFCLGAYAITHFDNAVQDVTYFRDWSLHKIHGDVICPTHYVCTPQATPQ